MKPHNTFMLLHKVIPAAVTCQYVRLSDKRNAMQCDLCKISVLGQQYEIIISVNICTI